ncbi:MAG: hypothetical protein LBB52_08375 [Desulfovibrio sp.]|jgi:hypothetical protein|nr:hypothetical protein [Desulfovibrio sp.]
MNVLLKNMLIILLAAFGTASCGFLDVLLEPVVHVPTTPADRPFPKRAQYDNFASLYAYECLEGKYTGEQITGQSGGKFWVNKFMNLSKIGRPNPDGRGKIYELYLREEVKTPPPLSADINDPWGVDKWGYSFTFYTTDDDIVTDCKVTRQLLFRL